MIGLSLESVKQSIIDRKKVMDAAARLSNKNLGKIGAFVRRRAKSSIRDRKRVSEPGRPPSSHTGLIKQFIFFVVEAYAKNVIIGPILLNRRSPSTLPALEHGGETLIMRHKKPVRISIAARPFMKPAFDAEAKKSPKLWEDALR